MAVKPEKICKYYPNCSNNFAADCTCTVTGKWYEVFFRNHVLPVASVCGSHNIHARWHSSLHCYSCEASAKCSINFSNNVAVRFPRLNPCDFWLGNTWRMLFTTGWFIIQPTWKQSSYTTFVAPVQIPSNLLRSMPF